MKKIVAFLLVIATVFLLTSCNTDKRNVIEINETTNIDSEIFSYFLNDVYYRYENKTELEYIDLATSACLGYVAVNTEFSQSGKKLTPRDKADISKETNALWRIYGDYYEQIGVSKETFFKINQYKKFKEVIRLSIYDTNGTNPIKEEYIKEYFTTNNVGIKYFYQELYTPLSDAEYSALTDYDKKVYDAEKKAANDRYEYISEIANFVNSEVYTMDEAFMAVTGEVSADISVSAAVVGKEGSSFSTEFVNAVFRQATGSAFIITNADKSHVYFIERIDLLDSSYNFYEQHRNDCLKAVTESFLTEEINNWIEENTEGLIKDMLSELDEDTAMVLVNALLFDDEWLTPYEEE
ncbi:MAG: hypothetical protein IKL09_03225, partial [Clostridia bacterium]|nr:hypothetical protein [Clostridia bacterium]